MDASHSRITSRVLLVAGALACAGVIGFFSIRNAFAAHWAGSRDSAKWRRAAQLEPGNAELWGQLGLLEEWDFERGNLQQAVAQFQRATEINPHSDVLWMDLAGAYEMSGQPGSARQAYQKALAAHPDSAEVAWRYGSFLLRQGDAAEAAPRIRRALVDEPERVPGAVAQFLKAGLGIDVILEQVMPPQVADCLQVVCYFVSQQQDDAALAAWTKLVSLHPQFRVGQALDLIDKLIADYRIDDAERVWRQAFAAAGISSQLETGGSLVFNGGFERDFLGGGFDWRWQPADGVAFDLVSDVTQSGQRSARISFNGSANVEFRNLQQFVPVTPGRHYHFSAAMQTDDITTDSGPAFQVTDCADLDKPVAQTAALTGTHPWTTLETDFTAGPAMRCALIMLRRPRSSMMFDDKIRGTVWVDDVRMQEVQAGGASR